MLARSDDPKYGARSTFINRNERGPLNRALAEADVSRWQCWQMAHWSEPTGTFLFENIVKALFGIGQPDPAKITAAAEAFHPLPGILNSHLAERD